MENFIKELDADEIKMIEEYRNNKKLHKDFLPFTTYELVQSGYPAPNKGMMIARSCGGTNKERELLPSTGEWCKVKDIKHFLSSTTRQDIKNVLLTSVPRTTNKIPIANDCPMGPSYRLEMYVLITDELVDRLARLKNYVQ